MLEQSNLLLSNDQNDLIQQKDSRIMKIQHNLIMMGFDITMINKILSNFKIANEQEAIDYLIKSENGMWNHPFIPCEEEPEEIDNTNLIEQPKAIMGNVFSKLSSIKNSVPFVGKNQENIDDEGNDVIINEKNNGNIIEKKIINENICDICGESKEFHIIQKYEPPNNNIIEEEEDIKDINNDSNLINSDINTNSNIIKKDEEEKEDDEEDKTICGICLDDFDHPIEIEKCRHKFCRDCFHSYLVNKITTNQIDQIPCPKKKCKNQKLTENFFSVFLTEQEDYKYRQFKAQNEIARDAKKVFCPLCDSYADIELDQLTKIDSNSPDYIKSKLTCKKGHEFCSCGRPLHEGDCYHDENDFKIFLEKEQIKKCPKCGFLIKKNKGCNHMTCGNPTCRNEFCWLCLKEAVPDHFKYGPCAGKQFFDPESFSYRLKQNHPCLYYLYSIFMIFVYAIVIIIAALAVPGIGISIIAFLIIFSEEDSLEEFNTSAKVIMFLGYSSIGFPLQSIIYILWALLFAALGLFITVLVIGLVFELIKSILNCLFCGCLDGEEENNNNNNNDNIHELQENINENNQDNGEN